jgi:hypothetical protein
MVVGSTAWSWSEYRSSNCSCGLQTYTQHNICTKLPAPIFSWPMINLKAPQTYTTEILNSQGSTSTKEMSRKTAITFQWKGGFFPFDVQAMVVAHRLCCWCTQFCSAFLQLRSELHIQARISSTIESESKGSWRKCRRRVLP